MLNEVYDFIFETFQKNAPDLMRAGNMRPMNKEVYAPKKGVSSADFPELQMGLVQILGPLTSTSSHSKYDLIYDLRVASGNMSQATINELMWWVLTRVQWLNMNRGIFDYKSSQPITSVSFADSSVGLAVEETGRNVTGFSSLTKIRVQVHVPHSLFIPSNCDNV
jgi:hypothetical protein